MRHRYGLVYVESINIHSSELDQNDSAFVIRAGLAQATCYSFESKNYPGRYLRHQYYRLQLHALESGSSLFNNDATFCPVPGLNGSGVSFQSINYPGYFLRTRSNGEVWLDQNDGSAAYENAASYFIDIMELLRADVVNEVVHLSSVTNPANMVRDFREHFWEPWQVYMASYLNVSERDKGNQNDWAFVIRPGLARETCYSFESKSHPERYLSHDSDRMDGQPSQLTLFSVDGTSWVKTEATFCPVPGLSGSGVSFQSIDYPGYFLATRSNGEVWLDPYHGSAAYAYAASYSIAYASVPKRLPQMKRIVLKLEAEGPSALGHSIGRADGDSWSANTSADGVEHLIYGPFATNLGVGNKVAIFRTLLDNVTAGGDVFTLDAYDTTTGQVFAQRTVARAEFAQPGQYQDVPLYFNLDGRAGHTM
jgi:hypothetical protein